MMRVAGKVQGGVVTQRLFEGVRLDAIDGWRGGNRKLQEREVTTEMLD